MYFVLKRCLRNEKNFIEKRLKDYCTQLERYERMKMKLSILEINLVKQFGFILFPS